MRPLASKPSDGNQGEPRCGAPLRRPRRGAPLSEKERPIHPARRSAAPTDER
jgi:hypothetical protein